MELALSRLPQLVESGIFGDDVKFDSIVADDDAKKGNQYASEIAMVILRTRDEKLDKLKDTQIVVKVQLDDPMDRDARDSYAQFYNEVIMYKEILPYVNTSNDRFYPKMYYGEASLGDHPETDLVIMENMNSSGYVIAKNKLFLDFEHIAIAMRRLGEFHSWSYNCKSKNSKMFFEHVNKLKIPDGKSAPNFDPLKLPIIGFKRGIKPLLEKNIEVDALQRLIMAFQDKESVNRSLTLLQKEEEPFGVLTHGDFCKNNVLFRYNESNEPIDCAFFDFQTSRYGSPVADLSFFLYMHTTKELRDKHWDNFLSIYWKSLKDNVHSDVELPKYEQFLNHFASRAVFGYYPGCFFAPILVDEAKFNLMNFQQSSEEEQNYYCNNVGGAFAQELITDIASHLLERKYVQEFLKLSDSVSIEKSGS